MDEVFQLADSITVLRDGRHVETLATTDTNPREITHRIGRSRDRSDARRAASHRRRGARSAKLSLAWPGHARRWRLEEISFSVRRGEIVGIARAHGGWSHRVCSNVCSARVRSRRRGRILLEDKVVKFRHPAEAREAGLALVTEDRKRLGLFAD